MLTRETVIKQAFHDCMKEMYAKAQPSADYDMLVDLVKKGIINEPKTPVYQRYYLSQKEFEYIRNKYIEAYGLKSHWKSDIEVLEKYLKEGGVKDKYIERDGNNPGYRGYEQVIPLEEQLRNLTDNFEEIADLVFANITDCKNFYRFDREEDNFSCSVTLGASPTSNPQSVIDFWKSQGIDVVIEERNPLLFWEMDYYGEDFEVVMENDYGPDWKTIWKYKLKNGN